jgi:hypothetical protein
MGRRLATAGRAGAAPAAECGAARRGTRLRRWERGTRDCGVWERGTGDHPGRANPDGK